MVVLYETVEEGRKELRMEGRMGGTIRDKGKEKKRKRVAPWCPVSPLKKRQYIAPSFNAGSAPSHKLSGRDSTALHHTTRRKASLKSSSGISSSPSRFTFRHLLTKAPASFCEPGDGWDYHRPGPFCPTMSSATLASSEAWAFHPWVSCQESEWTNSSIILHVKPIAPLKIENK